MPKFFFNILTPDQLIVDDEGTELRDLNSAKEEAASSARDLIADARRAGGDVSGYVINVVDEAGQLVLVYSLKNLLNGSRGDL